MSKEIQIHKNTMIVSETDEKGIIIYANDDFCNIAGYSKEPKVAFQDLWNTVQSGKVWNGIVKNKTKSGDFYWVNATAYQSKTQDGKLRYISVRVCPTDDEIKSAEALYKTLR